MIAILLTLKFISKEVLILVFLVYFIYSFNLLQIGNFINFILCNSTIIDSINYLLVILLIYILLVRLLSKRFLIKFTTSYTQTLIIISLILILFFVSSSLINFYIFFEFSILPIFMIIIGWGYQTERVRARLSLIFYTVLASIPLLIYILSSYKLKKIFFFYQLGLINTTNNVSYLILLSVTAAFLIKLPIFLGHL